VLLLLDVVTFDVWTSLDGDYIAFVYAETRLSRRSYTTTFYKKALCLIIYQPAVKNKIPLLMYVSRNYKRRRFGYKKRCDMIITVIVLN